MYENWSIHFRSFSLKVEIVPSCLKRMNSFLICVHIEVNDFCCLLQAMQSDSAWMLYHLLSLPMSRVRWSREIETTKSFSFRISSLMGQRCLLQSTLVERSEHGFHFYSLNRIETFVSNSREVLYFTSLLKLKSKRKVRLLPFCVPFYTLLVPWTMRVGLFIIIILLPNVLYIHMSSSRLSFPFIRY